MSSKRGPDLRKLELLARAAGEPRSPGDTSKPKANKSGVGTTKQKLKLYGNVSDIPWVDRYLPSSLADHFVHKNKVAQFQGWLQNPQGSKICLMTGGSGVGKTATVHLVAASLGFQVREWVNSPSLTNYQGEEQEWRIQGDEVRGRSLVDEFTDFLFGSSQCPSLPVRGKTRLGNRPLVLIEDFPNFFYRDVSTLHELIKQYRIQGECPLVFIMSDTATSDSGAFKLFPKALRTECQFMEIEFNAVAPSYMTKFANSVLSQANADVKAAVVAEIVTASTGDMRSCINNLQFRLQKPKLKSSSVGAAHPAKKRRLVQQPHDLQSLTSKDDALFLFHAIGKVLYCKRDRTMISQIETTLLNDKMSSQRRIHALKEIPEKIGDRIAVAPETFFNFLGENYLSFFSVIDDVVKATGYLADASKIFSTWILDDMAGSSRNFKNWEAREEFALSLGIRGLMFANANPVGSVWKPMRKPKFGEVNALAESMIQNTQAFCPGPVTQDYYTDLIPLSALIRVQDISQAKRDFLREFGTCLRTRDMEITLEVGDGVGNDEVLQDLITPASKISEIVIDRGATEKGEGFTIEDVPD